MSKSYNPEKRAWRGRSYRKGGTNIRTLRDEPVDTDFSTEEWKEAQVDAEFPDHGKEGR